MISEARAYALQCGAFAEQERQRLAAQRRKEGAVSREKRAAAAKEGWKKRRGDKDELMLTSSHDAA